MVVAITRIQGSAPPTLVLTKVKNVKMPTRKERLYHQDKCNLPEDPPTFLNQPKLNRALRIQKGHLSIPTFFPTNKSKRASLTMMKKKKKKNMMMKKVKVMIFLTFAPLSVV